jgi:acyl carrier protein
VDRSAIKEKISNFITNSFVKESGIILFDDTLLLENKIIDSTGVIELVSFLETAFGVIIEDEQIIPENLNSLNCITNFVQTKILQTVTI